MFNSLNDYAYYISLSIAIYTLFFLLGYGFSAYASFSQCQKVDARENAIQGAIWAVYPTTAWIVIRPFDFIRVYFDRFFTMFGIANPSWVSIGYVMTLGCIAGVYSLYSESGHKICVPSVDEATRFKEALLAKQKEKEEKIKEAQENTPAVVKV